MAEPPSSPNISWPTSAKSTLPYAAIWPAASDAPPLATSTPTPLATADAFSTNDLSFSNSAARLDNCSAVAAAPSSCLAASTATRLGPVAMRPPNTVPSESTAAVVIPLVLASEIAFSVKVLSCNRLLMFSSVGCRLRAWSSLATLPINSDPVSIGTWPVNAPATLPIAAPAGTVIGAYMPPNWPIAAPARPMIIIFAIDGAM